jgi:hypothetical protein
LNRAGALMWRIQQPCEAPLVLTATTIYQAEHFQVSGERLCDISVPYCSSHLRDHPCGAAAERENLDGVLGPALPPSCCAACPALP